jgi:CRISPR/Cas system-associated endoribonuclease Cas2
MQRLQSSVYMVNRHPVDISRREERERTEFLQRQQQDAIIDQLMRQKTIFAGQ